MTYQEEMFQKVKAEFEKCIDLGSGEMYRLAAQYYTAGLPDVTFALISHAADINTHEDPFGFMEKSWTEVHVETFRRAFYDEDGAAKYGTSHVYSNCGMLKLVTHELLAYASSYSCDNVDFQPIELPDNVVRFPTPCKTRQ